MIKTSKKIKVFGTWAVTTGGVECLVVEYYIKNKDIFDDWITHMEEKRKGTCGKFNDFVRAIKFVRKRVRVKEIQKLKKTCVFCTRKAISFVKAKPLCKIHFQQEKKRRVKQ